GGQGEIPVRAYEGTGETNERPVTDINEGTRNTHMDGTRKFGEFINPMHGGYRSAIVRSPLTVNSFELKASVIQLVQNNTQFGGLPSEDSNQHITNFLEVCDTVKIGGVSNDEIRRRLFPFSLRDKVRAWLQGQPKDSLTTWEEVARAFSNKYFTPTKTDKCRNGILMFVQLDYESLYESWERYNELLRKCPNYELSKWQQLQIFY